MTTSELKPGFHAFGNKGMVWSNKFHIAQNGLFSTTLCGTPMLSSNWIMDSLHQDKSFEPVACPECKAIYDKLKS